MQKTTGDNLEDGMQIDSMATGLIAGQKIGSPVKITQKAGPDFVYAVSVNISVVGFPGNSMATGLGDRSNENLERQ